MLYILVYIFICTLTIVIRSSALFVGFYICLVKRVFMFLTFWLQILRGLALSGGSRISWVWLSYQGTVLSAGPKPQMYTGINMEIGFKKNGTILSHLKIETGIIKKWFVYPFQDRPFQKLDVYTVSDFLLVIWNISYGMLTVLRFSGWAPQSPDSCPYWPIRQFQNFFWTNIHPCIERVGFLSWQTEAYMLGTPWRLSVSLFSLSVVTNSSRKPPFLLTPIVSFLHFPSTTSSLYLATHWGQLKPKRRDIWKRNFAVSVHEPHLEVWAARQFWVKVYLYNSNSVKTHLSQTYAKFWNRLLHS